MPAGSLKIAVLILAFQIASSAVNAQTCTLTGSTATNPTTGKIELTWRTDFPNQIPTGDAPWVSIDFQNNWESYIRSVLGTIKAAGLNIANNKISMPSNGEWWIVPWMDYTDAGRESLAGLTKERSSTAKDLGPNSERSQLWAVGWYNSWGAYTLGKIFSDPCEPNVFMLPFIAQTASVKFLFTDADPASVSESYLVGSPEILATIDAPGVFGFSDPTLRKPRIVRLLQVDVAVRDARAADTGWVFGTFVWKGPKKGDGLFDNLEPVGLQWGNDPTVRGDLAASDMSSQLSQQKLNEDVVKFLTAWPERPWMGFQGRLNGPADNKLSTCLSCHGAAQTPRSTALSTVESDGTLGIGGNDPPNVVRRKIAKHTFNYFRNVQGGELFDPTEKDAVSLDYSLQLEASFARLCTACAEGNLSGITPKVCGLVRPFLKPGVQMPHVGEACGSPSIMMLKSSGQSWQTDVALPRQ